MRKLTFTGVLLFVTLLTILTGCSKKKETPCMKELDCTSCDCIFEKMQQNLNNPELLAKLRKCYANSKCQ